MKPDKENLEEMAKKQLEEAQKVHNERLRKLKIEQKRKLDEAIEKRNKAMKDLAKAEKDLKSQLLKNAKKQFKGEDSFLYEEVVEREIKKIKKQIGIDVDNDDTMNGDSNK